MEREQGNQMFRPVISRFPMHFSGFDNPKPLLVASWLVVGMLLCISTPPVNCQQVPGLVEGGGVSNDSSSAEEEPQNRSSAAPNSAGARLQNLNQQMQQFPSGTMLQGSSQQTQQAPGYPSHQRQGPGVASKLAGGLRSGMGLLRGVAGMGMGMGMGMGGMGGKGGGGGSGSGGSRNGFGGSSFGGGSAGNVAGGMGAGSGFQSGYGLAGYQTPNVPENTAQGYREQWWAKHGRPSPTGQQQ